MKLKVLVSYEKRERDVTYTETSGARVPVEDDSFCLGIAVFAAQWYIFAKG